MSGGGGFADLGDLDVTVAERVATVRMLASGDEQYARHGGAPPTFFPKHKQVGQALQRLRNDDDVHVIVLTGAGDHFFVPPSASPGGGAGHTPQGDWQLSLGLSQTLQAMVETEKPIVGRVNGDAVGFGSSLVFACDFVVAVDDALIADHHLGMGELPYGRADVGVVPGDGGAVFVPLALPPCLAKEYLLLAKPFRGAELAAMGVFNRSVPAADLDAAVDDLVARLLRRPLYPLAWGKRVINRLAADQLNRVFDAASGYEVAGFGMNRAEDPGLTGAS